MVRTHSPGRTLLICAILIGLTVMVFWPVWRFDLINFDDPIYVSENPQVLHGLTHESAAWALKTGYASNWHPLTWMSLMLDVQLFGSKPAVHHSVNLFFHAANVLLLFLVLSRMTGTFWRSAFVAALFAVHPLHVESVAWIAERKDVLSGFFFLLTLLAYGRYAQGKPKDQSPTSFVKSTVQVRNSKVEGQKAAQKTHSVDHVSRFTPYLLSLLFFALGLMSKPMLVTVPFVLLLFDYWPLQRLDLSSKNLRLKTLTGLIIEKIPFFALSAASCIVTMSVQTAAMVDPNALPLSARMANAVMACFDYLRQTFWPTHLAVFYPYPVDLPWGAAIAAGAVLLFISGAVIVLARRVPYAPVGWFWYLGMLVPVIGLVQVGSQARADRYTYLPLIGIFILLAWLAGKAIANRDRLRFPLASGAVVIVAALAVTAHQQVQYWRNSEALFTHAGKVTDDNYSALGGLGIVELRRGNYAEAMKHLTAALDSAQRHGAEKGIKYYIGAGLQMQGKGIEALPWLEDSQVVVEQQPERNYRLGLSLLEAGRLPEAEAHFQEALKARPNNLDFQLAMAALRHQQGRNDEAEALYKELIAAHPDSAQAQKSLADLLVLLKRLPDALPHYAAAVNANPNARMRQAYASALGQAGKSNEAIEQLQEALKAEPNNLAVKIDLAELLNQVGRNREAIAIYEKALETEPKQITVLNNLAWLLATCPDDRVRDGKRAVELAERACQVSEWKSAFLIGTLAAAYAEAGEFTNAVATAEKAVAVARANNLEEVAKRNEELLQMYKERKPYREK